MKRIIKSTAIHSYASVNLNSAAYRLDNDPPGQPVPPPLYEKSIAYDYESRDYAMFLDTGPGPELVGFARTFHEAETALDQLVFELLNGARETTHTPDPEDNHCCGDCGAALNEFGLCETCIDRAEGEDASDENECHDERTAEYEPKPRPRGAFAALRVDEPERTCPELVALAIARAG